MEEKALRVLVCPARGWVKLSTAGWQGGGGGEGSFAGEGLPAKDLIDARVCEHLRITGRTMLAVVLPAQDRGGLPTVR